MTTMALFEIVTVMCAIRRDDDSIYHRDNDTVTSMM